MLDFLADVPESELDATVERLTAGLHMLQHITTPPEWLASLPVGTLIADDMGLREIDGTRVKNRDGRDTVIAPRYWEAE